jgi:phosphoglycerate dehydrogenase-like enzyme
MPALDQRTLDHMPKLKAFFYAAGAVKHIVTPAVWERGITVCSAWRVNAIPVSEFSLGAILLSLKQVWAYHRTIQTEQRWVNEIQTEGAYRSTVGLVSLGAIGWRVARLLQSFDVHVVAYDPFVSAEAAEKAGVRLVGLSELFEISSVVSVHAPLLPETTGLIGRDLLTRMRRHATLINTARGGVINEAELVEVMTERPDLTAVLDVTSPEPPVPGGAILKLGNILHTPHIAGSVGQEVQRMGDSMFEEYLRYTRGEPLQCQLTQDAVTKMA